jgi:hypothetical protein
MKIAIISLYYGEKFMNDTYYGRKTIEEYCLKHNYDFFWNNENFVKKHDRVVQWTKIMILQHYLSLNKYDYVVWIDADVLILNPNKTIEDFINRLMNNKNMMISLDHFGHLNTGVMFVKNTEYSMKLLKELWNYTQHILNEQGNLEMMIYYNMFDSKNNIELIKDPTEFNPFWWEYKKDMFLIHFPGCNEPNRPREPLLRMMDMFCPLFLNGDNGHQLDTEYTYKDRIKWLNEKAEQDVKDKKNECNKRGLYLPLFD